MLVRRIPVPKRAFSNTAPVLMRTVIMNNRRPPPLASSSPSATFTNRATSSLSKAPLPSKAASPANPTASPIETIASLPFHALRAAADMGEEMVHQAVGLVGNVGEKVANFAGRDLLSGAGSHLRRQSAAALSKASASAGPWQEAFNPSRGSDFSSIVDMPSLSPMDAPNGGAGDSSFTVSTPSTSSRYAYGDSGAVGETAPGVMHVGRNGYSNTAFATTVTSDPAGSARASESAAEFGAAMTEHAGASARQSDVETKAVEDASKAYADTFDATTHPWMLEGDLRRQSSVGSAESTPLYFGGGISASRAFHTSALLREASGYTTTMPSSQSGGGLSRDKTKLNGVAIPDGINNTVPTEPGMHSRPTVGPLSRASDGMWAEDVVGVKEAMRADRAPVVNPVDGGMRTSDSEVLPFNAQADGAVASSTDRRSMLSGVDLGALSRRASHVDDAHHEMESAARGGAGVSSIGAVRGGAQLRKMSDEFGSGVARQQAAEMAIMNDPESFATVEGGPVRSFARGATATASKSQGATSPRSARTAASSAPFGNGRNAGPIARMSTSARSNTAGVASSSGGKDGKSKLRSVSPGQVHLDKGGVIDRAKAGTAHFQPELKEGRSTAIGAGGFAAAETLSATGDAVVTEVKPELDNVDAAAAQKVSTASASGNSVTGVGTASSSQGQSGKTSQDKVAAMGRDHHEGTSGQDVEIGVKEDLEEHESTVAVTTADAAHQHVEAQTAAAAPMPASGDAAASSATGKVDKAQVSRVKPGFHHVAESSKFVDHHESVPGHEKEHNKTANAPIKGHGAWESSNVVQKEEFMLAEDPSVTAESIIEQATVGDVKSLSQAARKGGDMVDAVEHSGFVDRHESTPGDTRAPELGVAHHAGGAVGGAGGAAGSTSSGSRSVPGANAAARSDSATFTASKPSGILSALREMVTGGRDTTVDHVENPPLGRFDRRHNLEDESRSNRMLEDLMGGTASQGPLQAGEKEQGRRYSMEESVVEAEKDVEEGKMDMGAGVVGGKGKDAPHRLM